VKLLKGPPFLLMKMIKDILLKNLRNKARILLHYLDGKVKIDDRERIVYSDDYVGLDLVRYYASPLVKNRPPDALGWT